MKDILKTAFTFLSKSYWLFYLLPGIVALVVFFYTLYGNPSLNLLDDVVGPIGVFSALMFSVIFIVVEHFLRRKEKYSTENEEDMVYLERYQDFTKNTVAVISFSIFLAGIIILMVFVLQHVQLDNRWYVSAKNAIFSFLMLQYFAIIVIVVMQMYTMLIDDIEKE